MNKNKKIPSKKDNSYYMYGKHAIYAAIDNPQRVIDHIICTSSMKDSIDSACRNANRAISIRTEDKHQIERRFDSSIAHQGVIAQVERLPYASKNILQDMSQILILDHVTDPQNIGAIWRSAAAFGAEAIITTQDGAPIENAAWAKNACGTLELIPHISVTNLVSFIKQLKKDDFWIIGLDGQGECAINDIPDYDKKAIIMGAEGPGMRPLTQKNCDIISYLPISDKVESLNVSNATAIALYQLFSV